MRQHSDGEQQADFQSGCYGMTSSDFTLGFVLGMAGSLHCVQMCGPLLLSLNLPVVLNKRTSVAASHFLYHAGRIATYSALGALAGWLGHGVTQVARWESAASLAAGVLMLVAGLLMLGALRRPSFIQITPARVITSRAAGLLTSPTLASRIRLGALMGFIPCGLIYVALLKAMAPAEPLAGAVSMAGFGLGTGIPLFALGACSSYLARPLARYGPTLTAASVAAMGLFLVVRGMMPVTMAGHVHPH
jgi:sulfite exporter TauE/SafE